MSLTGCQTEPAAHTWRSNFPEDYHGQEVAGKIATFNVTVREGQRTRSARNR